MRILIISDDPSLTTGYGGQMRYIADHLNQEHEVCYVSLQKFGLPHWYSGISSEQPKKPFKVYPRAADNYGHDVVSYYVKGLKPDILLTFCDPGLQNGHVKALYNYDEKTGKYTVKPELDWHGKWVAGNMMDSDIWCPHFGPAVKAPDVVVSMSKFAEPIWKENTEKRVEVIWGGVDCNIFKPLEDRDKLRENAGFGNFFIAGAVGRNQVRKMWNQTIAAFGLFGRDKPDTKLVLHTEEVPVVDDNQISVDSGWRISTLAEKHGFGKGQLVFSFKDLTVLQRHVIQSVALNRVYNYMDCYLFLTGGEGFGVPTAEAMAAGCVPITTHYTTGPELCLPHGFTVPPKAYWEASNGIEWAIADEQYASQCLQKLYDNPRELEKRRRECRKFAEDNLDWKHILPKWSKLINSL